MVFAAPRVVVGSEFGYAESIGQLTLTSPDGGFLATSRILVGDHHHVSAHRASPYE